MSTPKRPRDEILIVLEGDAAVLSTLLPDLTLFDGAEVRLTWARGNALLRGEYVALSGRGGRDLQAPPGAPRPRRLRLELRGRPVPLPPGAGLSRAEPVRETFPRQDTPAYGTLLPVQPTEEDRAFLDPGDVPLD